MEQFGDRVGHYKGHVKIGGDKIFLGRPLPQGRTAWMRQPYEGEEDYRGYPVLTDEQVYGRLKSALERNVQILAHCNGDQAAEQYLSVMERLEQEMGRRLRRPVMITPAWWAGDRAARLQGLGAWDPLPSLLPAVYTGEEGPREKLRPGAGRAHQPRRYGGHLGDSLYLPPGCPGDPAQHAGDRVVRGEPAAPRAGRLLGEEERISTLEALKAVTVYAAYQYFEEDRKGSLAVGKAADFVILGQDPLTADPMALRDIPVLETIKDGRTIWPG